MSRTAIVLSAAALIAASTGSAQAQSAPAAPGLGGPVIPGVCLMSREAVIANAAVTKAADARLQQITAAARTEVENDRKPIDADLQAFQRDQAKLSAEQRTQRQQALAARLEPIQAKATLRGREIEATRTKAYQRISAELQPVIAVAYGQRKCGLLVDRNSVLGGNFANDLTADVVKGLDARISTITFEREVLPATPPAAATQR